RRTVSAFSSSRTPRGGAGPAGGARRQYGHLGDHRSIRARACGARLEKGGRGRWVFAYCLVANALRALRTLDRTLGSPARRWRVASDLFWAERPEQPKRADAQ